MPAPALTPLVLVVVVLIAIIVVSRRRGYPGGGMVVVRCNQGHLFTTMWVPLASFKAIRLGGVRLQRCPVGNHLAFVTRVRPEDLTEEERLFAEQHRDLPIP
jgi:hypothetical protein